MTSSQRIASDGYGAVGDRIAEGQVALTVGTHALIQERTRFARLGLAVIDEQHRFGVAQRQSLAEKGLRPDLLVMTATPIPRSLALTVYGDLDVSILDEMPPGRSPVETRVMTRDQRDQAVTMVRERLRRGGRAYIVFPLIDAGEGGAARLPSLEESGSWWAEALEAPHGVVHGRLGREERDATMSRFSDGSIRVLLATTVIEVGVDVPEATAMVILGAERFGLAQLHQLRGRIGRGTDQALGESICIAVSDGSSADAQRRLATFEASNDGFRIAEEDLRQRGPGEVLGTRQAGLPQFRFGDLARDWKWLVAARADAARLLDRLAEPGNESLRRQLERRIPALVAPTEEDRRAVKVLLVANVLPPRDLSGAGEQVLQLAWGLRQAGCDVDVLGRDRCGPKASKTSFPWYARRAVARRVNDWRPDVVQVHESDGGLVIRDLARQGGASPAPARSPPAGELCPGAPGGPSAGRRRSSLRGGCPSCDERACLPLAAYASAHRAGPDHGPVRRLASRPE